MQGFAQDLPAQSIPIRLGVSQMKVPNLIDLVRLRHRMTSNDCQKGKPFVLVNDTLCAVRRPAVLTFQSLRKREFLVPAIDLKAVGSFEQLLLRCVHGH